MNWQKIVWLPYSGILSLCLCGLLPAGDELVMSPVGDVNYPVYLESVHKLLWGNILVLVGLGPVLVFTAKKVRDVLLVAPLLCLLCDLAVWWGNPYPQGRWTAEAMKYAVAELVLATVCMVGTAFILPVLCALLQYRRKLSGHKK